MTARLIKPAPVRKSVAVLAPPQRAFDVFTQRIDAWWPRTHFTADSPLAQVVFEPGPQGGWFQIAEDGVRRPWGDVIVWDPPRRLVVGWGAWKLDPGTETEIEVTFTPEGAGTRVDLEHRFLERLGDDEARVRAGVDGPNGWGRILGLFAEAASKEKETSDV